jgi:hypothetical protein
VYYICPVVPFGMHLPMLLVRQDLRGGDETPDVVLRWLQEVSGYPELGAPLATLQGTRLWRDTHATFPVQPHALPDISTVLQVRPWLFLHALCSGFEFASVRVRLRKERVSTVCIGINRLKLPTYRHIRMQQSIPWTGC